MPIESPLHPWLDAYLDGVLPPDQKAEFERVLASDPALRDEVERQAAINQSLRQLFAIPDAVTVQLGSAQRLHLNGDPRTLAIVSQAPNSTGSEGPAVTRASSTRWWRTVLAMAASIAMILAGSYLAWTALKPTRPPRVVAEPMTLAKLYQRKVSAGFEPMWVCENDQQFADTFKLKLGQPLVLQPLPANMSCAGLDYAPSIGPSTVLAIMRVDGQPVLVVIDRKDADTGHTVSPDSGLQLRSAEIGSLVLHEIGPSGAMSTLPYFVNPDASEDKAGGGQWK